MSSNFWIKLYHEILHDSKMGRLPDNVWRRAIELFLLAGEMGEDGKLPDTDELAWLLRHPDPDKLEDELAHLEKVGIVTRMDEGWIVTNFTKRQKAIDTADRSKAYRERKRRRGESVTDDSHEPITEQSRISHNCVTERDTDIDIDIDSPPTPPKGDGFPEKDFLDPVGHVLSYGDLNSQATEPDPEAEQHFGRYRDKILQAYKTVFEIHPNQGKRDELLKLARAPNFDLVVFEKYLKDYNVNAGNPYDVARIVNGYPAYFKTGDIKQAMWDDPPPEPQEIYYDPDTGKTIRW